MGPARATTLVVALLAAGACGCSWLLGVSEDPVALDLVVDGSADAEPDAQDPPDAHDGALPDLPDADDAAVDDAPVE